MQYASKNGARRGYARAYAPDSAFPGIAPTNLILDAARDLQSGDPWGESCELLYALHRLWSDYAPINGGNSPIDARDAGDECPLYDDLSDALDALAAGTASAMIDHATRVALKWNRALELAGRDY